MDYDSRSYRYVGFDSKTYSICGKILLAVIVVPCTVALFILGLHIYVQYFWLPRRLRGSFRRRDLEFAGGEDPAMLHTVGLKKWVIETLPVFVFRAENDKDKEGLECAICLCEFEEKEMARLLPKCRHSFHIDCVDMWFGSHSTCPLCRTSARPEGDGGSVAVLVVEEESGEEQVSIVAVLVVEEESGEEQVSIAVDGDLCHSSSNLGEGVCLERSVVDIPARRSDGFSSPRDQQQQQQQQSRSVPQSPDRECSH